jgi:hypothetical protein
LALESDNGFGVWYDLRSADGKWVVQGGEGWLATDVHLCGVLLLARVDALTRRPRVVATIVRERESVCV